MMNQSETLRIMKLWLDWGEFLTGVMDKMIREYENELSRKDNAWEMTQQITEYLAKKQALVDLKNKLSKHYE